MSLEKDWENLNIPLFMHGDGEEYVSNDNLMVFSWGSLLRGLSTLLNHWLLAAFPKSCGKTETWEVIWKHLIGLSKHWLMVGTHQRNDHLLLFR